jgi:hypothetical protein
MGTHTLKEAFQNGKVVPYRDILSGKISENSFAVGFHSVLSGTADKIYNDPGTFYDLTHMTNNLKGIIGSVLTRVTNGGDRPVLIIDTTFGGGKTHSLVCLYHLFTSPESAKRNPEIMKVLSGAGLQDVPDISLVAIDCHSISSVEMPGKARTIWGEIARQLDKYDMMSAYDQKLRRPDSSTLEDLLESTGKPVLIMIDELVNYLKDVKAETVGQQNLAEITISFFHTMTDVVVNSKNAMFIVTLPGTESAYKEESEILEAYKKMVKEIGGREASFTVPMDRSEIYDVIRKRLFSQTDESYAREVAEELQSFYTQHSENFPESALKLEYSGKIARSYPFHPVLIDILYERIGTIAEFQKTRGVLRLLSHVLKNVYNNISKLEDSIITPGIVDLNDGSILQELTNKIARGEFQNVIQSDIVSDEKEAKCQKMDSKKEYGPATRIATTIYLYSLIGTTKEISKGCSPDELVLAASMERITYPKDVLNDAAKLENSLWYIYNKTGKWYFSVEANINRVIADEIQKFTDPVQYDPEIKTRLRKMLNTDYFDVHVWEEDIRDPHKPTLVVTNYHEVNGQEAEVPAGVKDIIEREGTSFRTKKNLMYVLVPREDRIGKMVDATKRHLAIKGLKGERRVREDIKSYSGKIDELFKEADSNLNSTIELCYSLIYYPRGTEVRCLTVLDGYEGAKNLPDKVYRALEKAKKIVETLTPEYLVDKMLEGKPEITVKDLWDNFEEAPAHILPKNEQVLFESISQGVQKGLFGIYTGGIGDILIPAINESNYELVGERFYYKRQLPGGPKDGNYILPGPRADGIETKLKEIAQQVSETVKKVGSDVDIDDSKTDSKTKTHVPPPPQIKASIEDPSKIKEYTSWSIKEVQLKFSDTHLFRQLQDKLSLMLLGVSGVRFSVAIKSKQMDLIIQDSNIQDVASLMDILFKISDMFNENLNTSLSVRFEEEIKIDEDIASTVSDFGSLREALEFKAELEK